MMTGMSEGTTDLSKHPYCLTRVKNVLDFFHLPRRLKQNKSNKTVHGQLKNSASQQLHCLHTKPDSYTVVTSEMKNIQK